MTYLLDTTAVSALMREDKALTTWLNSVAVGDRVVICPIVRGEILFGIGRLGQGRRREVLLHKAAELFQALPCEVIPELAGDFYRSIKLTQRRLGLPLDENDLWISATAAAIGATVVSLDKDFQRLEGVAVIAP